PGEIDPGQAQHGRGGPRRQRPGQDEGKGSEDDTGCRGEERVRADGDRGQARAATPRRITRTPQTGKTRGGGAIPLPRRLVCSAVSRAGSRSREADNECRHAGAVRGPVPRPVAAEAARETDPRDGCLLERE